MRLAQGERPKNTNRLLTRREVLHLGLRTALGSTALLLEGSALFELAQLETFIARAPTKEQLSRDRAAICTAQLGNVSQLIRVHPLYIHLLGDSEDAGWIDGPSHDASGSQFADNVNRLLKQLHVPWPEEHDRNDESPYCKCEVVAKPGRTIRGIREQIANFKLAAESRPSSTQPRLLGISGGGNNAIQFLLAHANARAILAINDFETDFLPTFKRDHAVMLQDAIGIKNIPSMSGLSDIYVMGIPDLGHSKDLGIMQWPLGSDVASAACRYVNHIIINNISDAQEHTDVKLHHIDVSDVPVGRIHPTSDGYRDISMEMASITDGTFPDGSETSFLRQFQRHHIVS